MEIKQPIKIIFEMDGAGVVIWPDSPVHLDALIAWAVLCEQKNLQKSLTRDEKPDMIQLPLKRWKIKQWWGWCASSLFVKPANIESVKMWRKKFRAHSSFLCHGSPNLRSGIYREYNCPLPLVLCQQLVGYAMGEPNRIKHLLKTHIKYIGQKRSYGIGKVLDVAVEIISQDFSCLRDGKAQRWLPNEKHGNRLVRLIPPYWNNVDKVPCCEVGDNYENISL